MKLDFEPGFGEDRPMKYSLEYFVPKTQTGLENLLHRIKTMIDGLHPSFISITCGSGELNSKRSLELAVTVQEKFKIPVLLHLTCTNMPVSCIDSILQSAKEHGLQNILALRGDPPENEDAPSSHKFEYAKDLVAYIRKTHGDYFYIGVAAYPEIYCTGSHLSTLKPKLPHSTNLEPSGECANSHSELEESLNHLEEKCSAGADFIVSQFFYDIDKARTFFERLSRRPVLVKLPIISSVMPIINFNTFKRLTKLSRVSIPTNMLSELERVKHDDGELRQKGIELICRHLIKPLLDFKLDVDLNMSTRQKISPRDNFVKIRPISCLHFSTLNIESVVTKLIDYAGLQPDKHHADINLESALQKGVHLRDNHIEKHINDCEPPKFVAAELELLTTKFLRDEYPNGRFGDSESPAFGQIDGYGPVFAGAEAQAKSMFGDPESFRDVQTLFENYLTGSASATPWSLDPLSLETKDILSYLLKFNKLGYLTVSSQPSVNGERSDDEIYGWGPKNGYIYQKAFVEFFVFGEEEKEKVKEKIRNANFIKDPDLVYYISNRTGNVDSNVGGDSRSVVTWGVFPDHEIVAPTMIDSTSFEAWRDEAFDIWDQWIKTYEIKSKSRSLLQTLCRDCWLVSVIDHDYISTTGKLWQTLARDPSEFSI